MKYPIYYLPSLFWLTYFQIELRIVSRNGSSLAPFRFPTAAFRAENK